MTHNFRFHTLPLLGVGILVGAGCATVQPPHELTEARAEYEIANNGPAKTENPSGLYEGKQLLDRANAKFAEDPESPTTRDLAYLALRRVQLAEATAGITVANAKVSAANQEKQKETESALKNTRTQLADSKTQQQAGADALQTSNEALSAEKIARIDADRKAEDANANLAKIALVKQESRGLVITLSGSVLFKTSNASLLPDAYPRLNEVAQALEANDSKRFVVEGHTDSRGSDATNQDLSVRRAQTVREYLVSRGVPSDRITAMGYGKSRPIAENNSAEGRANNRRVEIVISPLPN